MKKIFVTMIAMLLVGMAQAQIVTSSSKTIKTVVKEKKASTSYNRINIEFASLIPSYSLSVSGTNELDKMVDKFNTNINNNLISMPGAKIEYLRGISLSKKIPLYLQVGGEFQFNYRSGNMLYEFSYSGDDFEEYREVFEDKFYNYSMSVAVPVNVTYKYTLPCGFYVEPYAGINFRVNILGGVAKSDSDSDVDWFDKDDMGGSDNTFNRFQFGGQFGVNFGYKVLNVNIGYQLHTPIYSNSEKAEGIEMSQSISTRTFVAGIGFNF